ncbi:unnamed protein product [Lupinus luteus]|uniref:Uncharacterized protein n=1 Tax=Lupinus luteus TaxID=3873 RepID=A0AAV1WZQ4_LUPLU
MATMVMTVLRNLALPPIISSSAVAYIIDIVDLPTILGILRCLRLPATFTIRSSFGLESGGQIIPKCH